MVIEKGLPNSTQYDWTEKYRYGTIHAKTLSGEYCITSCCREWLIPRLGRWMNQRKYWRRPPSHLSFVLYQIRGTASFERFRRPLQHHISHRLSTLTAEKPQLLGIDSANVTGSPSAIRDALTRSVSVRPLVQRRRPLLLRMDLRGRAAR